MTRVTVGSGSLKVTTGWSIYPDDGTDPDDLIATAMDDVHDLAFATAEMAGFR